MDPIEELLELLTGTPDETPAPALEVRPRCDQQKLLDSWHRGETSSWQELLFGHNLSDEEEDEEMNRWREEMWTLAIARGARRHKT